MRSASMTLLLAAQAAGWTTGSQLPLRQTPLQRHPLVAMAARTTPSGLTIDEITAGTGESPSADSVVKVHYKGTLADGTVFDSSYDRGEPTEFKVNQVIEGWQEGLALMSAGGKAELTIPSALAYGDRAVGKIPPNSELTFVVELLEVKGGSGSPMPADYLGRSFGSASMKPKEGQESGESWMPDVRPLALIAAIGLLSASGILPK
jgi:hypothetical protein